MHTGSRLNSQNRQNEVLLFGEIQSVEGQTDLCTRTVKHCL